MTPEEEKYYDNYVDMFSTEGWKQFQAKMKESQLHIKDTVFQRNKEEFDYHRGFSAALDKILLFEELVLWEKNQLNEEEPVVSDFSYGED